MTIRNRRDNSTNQSLIAVEIVLVRNVRTTTSQLSYPGSEDVIN